MSKIHIPTPLRQYVGKQASIDVQGQTQSIQILGNEIRETQSPSKRIGIRIGPETDRITLRAPERPRSGAPMVFDRHPPTVAADPRRPAPLTKRAAGVR